MCSRMEMVFPASVRVECTAPDARGRVFYAKIRVFSRKIRVSYKIREKYVYFIEIREKYVKNTTVFAKNTRILLKYAKNTRFLNIKYAFLKYRYAFLYKYAKNTPMLREVVR